MTTPPESHPTPPANPARRKLAVLGVGAVATLASRPVLAGTCNSPSAAASGNMSVRGTPPMCSGRSPQQWVDASNSNDPNNGFPGGNVVFSTVFANGNGILWPTDDNGRLRQVMSAPDNSNANPTPNPISKEFAATLLNIRDGRIPAAVLDEGRLIGMWVEWRSTGKFSPMAGIDWDANQIVTYLRSLQGA